MSAADDRERKIIERCQLIFEATQNPISLHKSDFDFLMKRKSIDSFGKLKEIPVVRRR